MTKNSNDALQSGNTIQLNISQKEIDAIRSALIPKVSFVVPKGFYTLSQYSKMLKVSKSNLQRRFRKLLSKGKATMITGYCLGSNGRNQPIPYYKINNSLLSV